MFTAFSVDTWRSDLAEQRPLHQEQLRMTLRRLRRRAASASRSQRTARKSFDLSSVGRSFFTRFSSPLTSAHARPKRDAPHEET